MTRQIVLCLDAVLWYGEHIKIVVHRILEINMHVILKIVRFSLGLLGRCVR